MKRMIRNASVLVALAVTATACTRRVQVESEPNEPRYQQTTLQAPAQIDMVGTYDYVVDMDGGSGDITGPMTITRAADGGYAVHFLMQDGQEVPTRNVQRTGNELKMDVSTPGGEGAVMLEWVNANRVEGEVFIGETLPFSATRRS